MGNAALGTNAMLLSRYAAPLVCAGAVFAAAPAAQDHPKDGARINTRMGLNTWAAFTGTDADA